VAIFGVLKEVHWQPASIETIQRWLKTHRVELLVITLIIVAAFLIRILDIELYPYSFNNDEGNVGSSAICILQGGCKNFFVLDWAAQPELAYLAYAISIGIFGKTALAVRLVSVLTGTLSVLATYLLAKETFGKKIAWLAAVLLTTLPIHIHFSRMGVDNIIDSLTTPLMLWLLLRGARRSSRISFLAAGILAGLCMYTYPGSLLAPAFGIGALGLFALRTRGFLRAQAGNFVIFILAATLIVMPILGYYSAHSDSFMARMKRDGIFQNGNLEKAMQKTGKDAAETMLLQFTKSSLVYIVTNAPFNFFNSPKAYLPPFEAVIFMLGLAYMLWRIKDPRFLILFIWFWTVVILGSALTTSPPANQRLLMSMPALVIIISVALSKILDAFARLGSPIARCTPAVLLAAIIFIGYSNLTFYFRDYRMGHYYEDPKDELTYETRIYTMPLHNQGRVLLIGDPKTPYISFKSFDYFAPDVEKTSVNDINYQMLFGLSYSKDVLFIALPGYKADLQFIAQAIPGGEWHQVNRRYQPASILFYSYKLTKERLAVYTRFSQGYEFFTHP
jgi:4-amino-4-deoxy-L-arabinose transferase-like glycosyltransferase